MGSGEDLANDGRRQSVEAKCCSGTQVETIWLVDVARTDDLRAMIIPVIAIAVRAIAPANVINMNEEALVIDELLKKCFQVVAPLRARLALLLHAGSGQ